MTKLTLLLFALGLGACDTVSTEVEVGRRLDVTTYATDQPSSRTGYVGYFTFATGRTICVARPGMRPGELPALVRCIKSPSEIGAYSAQIDQDGFLWMATPDYRGGGPQQQMLVADPSTGEIVRVITVPNEVRGVGDLIVGPDQVYLRSLRDGFSGAVGVVDRRCAVDEAACEARLFTELGPVGLYGNSAFYLTDQYLYSFSNFSSSGERGAIDKIDLETGEIVLSRSPRESEIRIGLSDFVVVNGDFYVGPEGLNRVDSETLEIIEQVPGPYGYLLAAWDGLIYRTNLDWDEIEVWSAEPMEIIDRIDITAAGGPANVFGFVSPGVLMITGESFLDVTTGTLTVNHFPNVVTTAEAQKLRLGAGVSLRD